MHIDDFQKQKKNTHFSPIFNSDLRQAFGVIFISSAKEINIE